MEATAKLWILALAAACAIALLLLVLMQMEIVDAAPSAPLKRRGGRVSCAARKKMPCRGRSGRVCATDKRVDAFDASITATAIATSTATADANTTTSTRAAYKT